MGEGRYRAVGLSERERVCLECRLPQCWEGSEGCAWAHWGGKRSRAHGRRRWGWLQTAIMRMGDGEYEELMFEDEREMRNGQEAARRIGRDIGVQVRTRVMEGCVLEVSIAKQRSPEA